MYSHTKSKDMNNIFSKFKIPALIAFTMLSLSSCLKDEGFENGTYGMGGFAGGTFVAVPAASSSPFSISIDSKSGNQPLELFSVNYENVNKAPEDITVTFTKDDAAVTASGLGLTLLPASVLTFTSANPTVVIKQGTRVSPNFTCQINTGTLDPTKKYGLAFTISSVSKSGVAIPANLKTVVYKIALKNRWDGIYSIVSGLVTRYNSPGVPSNDALSGPLAGNSDVHLITSGVSELDIPASGTGSFRWSGNGGIGGIDGLRMSVNGTTNQVTWSCSGNATLTNWAGKVNNYDPATKTFNLNFRWNPAAATREYTVVLRYKSPR
jgi:hypothetical protein